MLTLGPKSGWLDNVTQVPSPNCDARPAGVEPDLIVVHSISLPPGEFGGPWINDFFQNRLDSGAHEYFEQIRDLQVSAHVLIRRDGQLLQYVPFHQRAWHAGVSCFQGRAACNDFSIGIELEGTDDRPFRAEQYWQLARLVAVLRDSYPALSDGHIVGHSDIAPGRKTDPGSGFSWRRFHRALQCLSTTMA